MMNNNEKKAEIKAYLSDARTAVFTAVSPLIPADWAKPIYSEGSTWQISDILRHVADSQSGMMQLMQGIQAGGGGVPEDFDLARWNAKRVKKYEEKSPADLLAKLEQDQVDLFAFIDGLEAGDWQKSGRHASLRIMSIEEICRLIADHETLHADEITAALSA